LSNCSVLFLFVCMLPLEPGKHSSTFVESSGPFLRSKNTFDCCLLQFFFGHFLAEKTSGTHTKTPFLLPIFFCSLHSQYRRAFGCWQHQKGHFQTEKVSFECIFDVVFVTTIAWTILMTITNLSLFLKNHIKSSTPWEPFPKVGQAERLPLWSGIWFPVQCHHGHQGWLLQRSCGGMIVCHSHKYLLAMVFPWHFSNIVRNDVSRKQFITFLLSVLFLNSIETLIVYTIIVLTIKSHILKISRLKYLQYCSFISGTGWL